MGDLVVGVLHEGVQHVVEYILQGVIVFVPNRQLAEKLLQRHTDPELVAVDVGHHAVVLRLPMPVVDEQLAALQPRLFFVEFFSPLLIEDQSGHCFQLVEIHQRIAPKPVLQQGDVLIRSREALDVAAVTSDLLVVVDLRGVTFVQLRDPFRGALVVELFAIGGLFDPFLPDLAFGGLLVGQDVRADGQLHLVPVSGRQQIARIAGNVGCGLIAHDASSSDVSTGFSV